DRKEDDSEIAVLHPQIEKLLDAITDKKRVQIISIDDFKRDLKQELTREITREVRKVLVHHLSQLTSDTSGNHKLTLQEQLEELEKDEQPKRAQRVTFKDPPKRSNQRINIQ